MARIVRIDADAKNDIRSVTLRVADKKGGPSQILRRGKWVRFPNQKPYQNRQNQRHFVGSQMKWCDLNLMLYNSII